MRIIFLMIIHYVNLSSLSAHKILRPFRSYVLESISKGAAFFTLKGPEAAINDTRTINMPDLSMTSRAKGEDRRCPCGGLPVSGIPWHVGTNPKMIAGWPVTRIFISITPPPMPVGSIRWRFGSVSSLVEPLEGVTSFL